jgi:hypothetical protein
VQLLQSQERQQFLSQQALLLQLLGQVLLPSDLLVVRSLLPEPTPRARQQFQNPKFVFSWFFLSKSASKPSDVFTIERIRLRSRDTNL